MKQFFLLPFIMAGTICAAQPNNPYNGRGADYLASLKTVQADHDAGRVREVNEETVAYYATGLPLRQELNAEGAGRVAAVLREHRRSAEAYISGSGAPQYLRSLLTETLFREPGTGKDNFLKMLVRKVEEISAGSLAEGEKETALTLLAILYNVAESDYAARGGSTCYVSGPNGMVETDGTPCILTGAGFGFLIGFEVCGIWCAVGGAIIGGILFGLS